MEESKEIKGFEVVNLSELSAEEKSVLLPSEKRNVSCDFPSSDEIRFVFKDEESIIFDLGELEEKIVKSARNHGMKQKLSDALAMSKELQEITSDEARRDLLLEGWEHLVNGSWNKPSKDGGKNSKVKEAAAEMAQVNKNIADMLKSGELSEEQLVLLKKAGLKV